MLRKTIAFAALFFIIGPNAFAQTQQEKKTADKKFWVASSLMVSSTVFDVESTYLALDKCAACYEKNLLMRPFVKAGRPWLYAIQGSIDAGVIYASYRMKKNGHKLWYVLPVAITVAHTAAGMHNIRLSIKF
jgi:hypothetical protein